MSEKFLNKYRIPSARWQDWNYKNAAAYFVTICTHNREHYFGENEFNKMISIEMGDNPKTLRPTPTTPRPSHQNKFGPRSRNLASVIRGFKSSVTTQVKKLYGDGRTPFEWQTRFHDHIIRDAESFDRIRQYIGNSPH